jgi:Xaa-Pro aminopeptidase
MAGRGDRTIPPQRYGARLAACREAVGERGLSGLMIGVGPDLRYLTGFAGEPMERLTLLIVPREGPVSFLAPHLEAQKASETPLVAGGHAVVVAFEETEDAGAKAAELLGRSAKGAVGLSDRLWAMHVLALQEALPDCRFERASTVMRELRQVKDEDEMRLLGLAAAAADRALDAVAAGRLVGRTEADVSREIRRRLLAEGHDSADFAIVGSGPNGASPHHDAGERLIAAGEPVVLDIGGTLAGYASDITRTVWVSGDSGPAPGPEFTRVYELVREAQARATAAVRPGVPAEVVDAAARATIAAAGYGEYFTHRVGHGIGLEVHEDPYMVAGNATPLRPGMAFSVEPGVYLPGRWGVRLENIVVCAPEPEDRIVLNHSPLDLRVVRG